MTRKGAGGAGGGRDDSGGGKGKHEAGSRQKKVKRGGSVLQYFAQCPLYGVVCQGGGNRKQQHQLQQKGSKAKASDKGGKGTAEGCVAFVCGGGGQGDYGVPNSLIALYLSGSAASALASHVDKRGAFNIVAAHPDGKAVISAIDGDLVVFSFDGSQFSETTTLAADLDPQDPLVSAMAFSPNGKTLATGGAEGVVRVWGFPLLKDPATIRLGSKVESLAFDASGKLLAISRTASAEVAVWHTATRKMHKTVTWRSESHVNRACAFARIGQHDDFLFTACNPKRAGRARTFVVQWDAAVWSPTAVQPVGKATLTSLATSTTGRYCAVGDANGGVTILAAESLKVLVRSNPHVLFVTSVAFTPSNAKDARGGGDEAVLSVSGDQACFLTPVKPAAAWRTGLLVLVISVFVVLVAHLALDLFRI